MRMEAAASHFKSFASGQSATTLTYIYPLYYSHNAVLFFVKVSRVQSAAADRSQVVEERHHRAVEAAERQHKRKQASGATGRCHIVNSVHIHIHIHMHPKPLSYITNPCLNCLCRKVPTKSKKSAKWTRASSVRPYFFITVILDSFTALNEPRLQELCLRPCWIPGAL